MDQIQAAYRLYPSGNTSTTLAVYFLARATEGVGNYGGLTSMPGCSQCTDLSIVYPNGKNDGVPLADIFGAIVQHLLNKGIRSWYSPPNGKTAEVAIFDALSACGISTGQTGINLFFDGQFGSVLAS